MSALEAEGDTSSITLKKLPNLSLPQNLDNSHSPISLKNVPQEAVSLCHQGSLDSGLQLTASSQLSLNSEYKEVNTSLASVGNDCGSTETLENHDSAEGCAYINASFSEDENCTQKLQNKESLTIKLQPVPENKLQNPHQAKESGKYTNATLSSAIDKLLENSQNALQPSLDNCACMPGLHSPRLYKRRNSKQSQDSASEPIDDTIVTVSRETWGRKLEFILSILGYSVGLGNLWRFPYLVYKNGGGAFFFPYILMLILCGLPMYFLEIALGQFAGQGPVNVWKLAPWFKGLGIGTVIVSVLVGIYYNVIIAWALFYLFASMQDPLPWQNCNNPWNTPACRENQFLKSLNCSQFTSNNTNHCHDLNVTQGLQQGISQSNATSTIFENISEAANYSGTGFASASEEYFHHYVLHISDGIGNLGNIQPYLVLCLLLSWILVFFSLMKGVKSSGKVVYVTAVLPYIVLITLLVRSCLLEGSLNGIRYYLLPRWNQLTKPGVWTDAAAQVFFSLGPCFGSLITLSSFNKFHNNCYRDSLSVAVINCVTSVIAGFVVFAIIGALAFELGTTVDKVVQQGSGLAFVVYPNVVARFPVAPLWSILFFVMLLSLGLDSQFAMIEAICTAIIDELPPRLRSRRVRIIGGVCMCMFFLGLPMCTEGGMYLLHLVDNYAAGLSVMLLAFFECVVMMWIYGFDRFSADIELMLGKPPELIWRIMWQYITPGIIMFMLVFSCVSSKPLLYGTQPYPDWATALGWMITCTSFLPVPTWMTYSWIRTPGTVRKRLLKLTTPSPNWGPGATFNKTLVQSSFPVIVMVENVGDKQIQLIQSESSPADHVKRRNSSYTSVHDVEEIGKDDLKVKVKDKVKVKEDEGRSARKQESEIGMNDLRGVIETEGWADDECSEDENTERGNWASRVEFILACLGYAVGLGNIWRFPYLCYRNGGGAFFIPYLLMFLFCGLPLFYLELAFGQFASLGPITIWKVAPLFKGVGYAMVIVSSLVAVYYNIIIAWTLFYLFASMTTDLPWAHCNNEWNTINCSLHSYGNPTYPSNISTNISLGLNMTTTVTQDTVTGLFDNLTSYGNNTSHDLLSSHGTTQLPTNQTEFLTGTMETVFQNITDTNITPQENVTGHRSPSEEYFSIYVLGKSSGIEDLGDIQWYIVLCLLLAWLLIFLCILKGVKSTGKVVYFTATFPYILLAILLGRALTLPGHEEGVRFLFTPQWDRLKDAQVWKDAAVQIFFSLSTCWGGLITLSSYNRFHNNCYRDAMIVAIANCATSLFAGLVIFAIMGVMANELNTTIGDVIEEEVGLAFIIYPDVVSRMPISSLWSILFFVMLLFVGLDTQFAVVETITTAIVDEFPNLMKKRIWVILSTCVIALLLGLPMCTQGGIYLLQLMDTYAASWSVMFIGIFELIAIAWVYGIPRFSGDIKAMIGIEPGFLWKILWRFFSPVVIVFILVFSWADYTPAIYGDYVYPMWADVMGWLMSLVSIMAIPVWAIYQLSKTEGSLVEKFRTASTHTSDWGPALQQHRYFISSLPRMYNYYTNQAYEESEADRVSAHGLSSRSRIDPDKAQLIKLNENGLHTRKPDPERKKTAKTTKSVTIEDMYHSQPSQSSKAGSSSSTVDPYHDVPPEYHEALAMGEYILVPKQTTPVKMEDKSIQTDEEIWQTYEKQQKLLKRHSKNGYKNAKNSPNSSCENIDTAENICSNQNEHTDLANQESVLKVGHCTLERSDLIGQEHPGSVEVMIEMSNKTDSNKTVDEHVDSVKISEGTETGAEKEILSSTREKKTFADENIIKETESKLESVYAAERGDNTQNVETGAGDVNSEETVSRL